MGYSSGVGVLDKAVLVLTAVEPGPARLGDLVSRTGLPRATVHRLAQALVGHGLLRLGPRGYQLGWGLVRLAHQAVRDPWLEVAAPVLASLQRSTGESAQLYQLGGQGRICVAAADPPAGLRDTVPVGAELPLTAGSAAQVLLAFDARAPAPPRGAAFDAADLTLVRRRGWAATVAQREVGVASVSAPVCSGAGQLIGAISVSGPSERMGRSPGRRFSARVMAAAAELSGLHDGDAAGRQGAG